MRLPGKSPSRKSSEVQRKPFGRKLLDRRLAKLKSLHDDFCGRFAELRHCHDVRVEAAFPLAASDAVVAFLAPALAPAVLDDPVFLATLLAEADDGHAVIEALRAAEDAELVLVLPVDDLPVADEDLLQYFL